MDTSRHRSDHGRAALATDLIATLVEQVPLGHPARATVRELQKLFAGPPDRVRELLDKVPGSSLQKKADRIGISKGTLWSIWRGRYTPNPEVLAAIEDAAAETSDG